MAKRARRTQPSGWVRGKKPCDPSTRAIAKAAARARNGLAVSQPLQSSKKPAGRLFVIVMALLACATFAGAFQIDALGWVWIVNSFTFAGLGCLRATACLCPQQSSFTNHRTAVPQAVPIWTILIALYQEADSVPSLLAALSTLNWAPNRLDVIFACEDDDTATLEILTAHQMNYDFRIVRVPSGGPRTKPNALQTALPFAKGRFLTVYDAEDRPDPQQLRAAFDAFIRASHRLAVVQAPLVTWNHTESWIAGQFALDYAIWFRVILPAFARVSGLIPLGGTSNHFRTDVLRKVGGWDPHNVTEDADLGVRLARFGYQASLITPPTYEEAPPKIQAWIKQRGRWIQGHIQTTSVHLRTPVALVREIGALGLVSFLIGLATGPMSALLVLPLTLGLLFGYLGDGAPFSWLPIITGITGNLLAAIVACYRDGRWSIMISWVTLPLYHCLQSLAACRAMWRVVFTPDIWDKTEHGCAARTRRIKGATTWIGQQP